MMVSAPENLLGTTNGAWSGGSFVRSDGSRRFLQQELGPFLYPVVDVSRIRLAHAVSTCFAQGRST